MEPFLSSIKESTFSKVFSRLWQLECAVRVSIKLDGQKISDYFFSQMISELVKKKNFEISRFSLKGVKSLSREATALILPLIRARRVRDLDLSGLECDDELVRGIIETVGKGELGGSDAEIRQLDGAFNKGIWGDSGESDVGMMGGVNKDRKSVV